jgi:hypothetical protein
MFGVGSFLLLLRVLLLLLRLLLLTILVLVLRARLDALAARSVRPKYVNPCDL